MINQTSFRTAKKLH